MRIVQEIDEWLISVFLQISPSVLSEFCFGGGGVKRGEKGEKEPGDEMK